ncbi:hypothetical protein CK203_060970 [Vitis vinifera]|uniref:Uncharacterized protein n=1 Tax=Vitis vinifera TaxID=29760 RepID=A0A438G9A4_VITVI|nr:hypothetical protein CK203_060970 [Vitis vinifera]
MRGNLMDYWDKEERVRSLSLEEEEEARKEAREMYKKWVLLEEVLEGKSRKLKSKRKVSRAFQGLLADPGDWKLGIDGLNFERLDEVDVEGLEKPFLEEDVFGALLGCCGEKAPNPDGFSMAF